MFSGPLSLVQLGQLIASHCARSHFLTTEPLRMFVQLCNQVSEYTRNNLFFAPLEINLVCKNTCIIMFFLIGCESSVTKLVQENKRVAKHA